MNKYIIEINGYKIKFNGSFPARYHFEELIDNADLIHTYLLKHYRNYVKNQRMQTIVLYKKEFIIYPADTTKN